jgi:urease accessory protein
VLEVNAPTGNIFLGDNFDDLKNGNFERLKITRMEMEKRILRRKTDRGTDVGLKLDPGIKLRHGDVFLNEKSKIVIEQLPEPVISVRLKNKNLIDVMILLGHIIGNRHRPIAINGDVVSFPILADSEQEVFSRLFHNIIDHIEITTEEQIFIPHLGANVHEH